MKSLSFFKNGFKKYKYATTLNANRFVILLKKVTFAPYPRAGNNLCQIKYPVAAKKKMKNTITEIDITIKLFPETALKPK